jgi:hypothetical protein
VRDPLQTALEDARAVGDLREDVEELGPLLGVDPGEEPILDRRGRLLSGL